MACTLITAVLTIYGYSQRSLKNVGLRLANVWRRSADICHAAMAGKDMVKIFHANMSKA